MKTKTKILILLAILAVVLTVAFVIAGKKAGWFEKSAVYEALVETRGEEAGDAIAVLPAGHEWSETEKTSYLILKLKITLEEAAKLTMAETREVEPPIGGSTSKEEAGPQVETIRARAYRLKIETLEFDPDEIWKGQPYADKIFDKKLIEKKK